MLAKKCPDCDCAMTEIRVIDVLHGLLKYAAGGAKRGIFRGHFPIEGQIETFMCDKCGRVLLYGKPEEQ